MENLIDLKLLINSEEDDLKMMQQFYEKHTRKDIKEAYTRVIKEIEERIKLLESELKEVRA